MSEPSRTDTPARAAGPSNTDKVLVLEHFLPYRLSVLSNTVSREIARRYEQRFGLSIPQWRVMAILGRFPDLTASAVVEKTAMDKVMVSRAVTGLAGAGHLNRTPDPGDRRRAALNLSTSGRAVYERIVPVAQAYETELLAALRPETRAVLDELIGALTARAVELGI